MNPQHDTDDSDVAANDMGSLRSWYLVGVCVAMMLCAYLDRQVLGLLVEPIKRDLKIDDVEFSLLTGLAFSIFFALCGLPIGRLLDSRRRTKIIAVAITIWSLATISIAFSRSFWHIFAARLAVGAGEAAASPGGQSMVTDAFLGRQLALAISMLSLGAVAGSGLALVLGGALLHFVGDATSVAVPLIGPMKPWQFVFLAVGLPGLVLAPLMAFTVREPKRRRLKLDAQGAVVKSSFAELARFIKANPRTVILNWFGYAVFFGAQITLTIWAPAYFIRVFKMRASDVGLMIGTADLLTGVTALMFGAWWIDRNLRQGRSAAPLRYARNGAMIGLLPIAFFPFAPTPSLALILLTLTLLCTRTSMASAISHQQLVPNQIRAQFSAAYLMIHTMIGLVVGPSLVAVLTEHVFHDPAMVGRSLAIVAGGAVALAALLLGLAEEPYRKSMAELKATA